MDAIGYVSVIGDRTEAIIDMWSRVKGDSLHAGTLIITGIVLVAIIIAFMAGRKKKKTKRRSVRR